MGVSVKGNDIFMAAVGLPTEEGRVADAIAGASGKISPSENLKGAVQLLDLKNRVQADLRDWGTSSVCLIETMKHSQWVYSQAHSRILSVSAVMYACAEENVEFFVVRPGDAGRVILRSKLDKIEIDVFGLDSKPTFWTTGLGEAFAAAAVKIDRLKVRSKA